MNFGNLFLKHEFVEVPLFFGPCTLPRLLFSVVMNTNANQMLEDAARKILSIFVTHFNCRPGHIIVHNNLLARGLSPEDLIKGLEYAKEMGWIEFTKGSQYRLTQAGFSEGLK